MTYTETLTRKLTERLEDPIPGLPPLKEAAEDVDDALAEFRNKLPAAMLFNTDFMTAYLGVATALSNYSAAVVNIVDQYTEEVIRGRLIEVAEDYE